ncbi:MAG: hypothetical protein ABI072_07555 [Edaphobacter sp.]
MAILQNTSPASLRADSSVTRETRDGFAFDPRPHLVTVQRRKSVVSAQEYLMLFPHESEDARLTGCTRSLYRRLLALNLPGTSARFEASADYTAEVIEGIFGRSQSKIAS